MVKKIILPLAAMLLALMAICSCTTTKYVTVPEYHYRDTARIVYQRDSIYSRDSIYMYAKGDTVFREHFNVKYREFYYRDTLNIVRADSIKVPYPVVKDKIVYQLHWWQKGPYYIGWIAILALLIYIIMWLVKKNILHL